MTVYRRDDDHTDEGWTQPELRGRRFGAQKPLYLLTGPHTFSGGEAFVYPLQALGRARVRRSNLQFLPQLEQLVMPGDDRRV